MPGIGRFPCETCEYVATNKRMLSRHILVAHSDKVYKCPVCPFITRYAANWYRHKRDLHGLSKLTTCEVCGFFANSAEDLVQHTESEHPEQLHKFEERFLKQKHSNAAGSETRASPDDTGLDEAVVEQNGNSSIDASDGLYGEDVIADDDSVKFSLPVNGGFLENDLSFAEDKAKQTENLPSQPVPPPPPKMDLLNSEYGDLSPPKIRRSYCCNLCGLLTSNPREFLYHQRDIHGMRVNVFECKLCIYASKHVQKLQRHYGLVHRQKMTSEDKPVPAQKSGRNKKPTSKSNYLSNEPFSSVVPAGSADTPYEFPDEEPEWPAPLRPEKPKRVAPGMLKCAACSYHTRNKFLLIHHEKTVHLKKKFFRCLQCGYVTNEKARYTKHIKYHSLPKMQCEFCHFQSAYKWNMERHMKSHAMGREGEFTCTLCVFITHSKQSLKMHVANHHQPEDSANDYQHDDPYLENSTNESNNDSNEFDWVSFESENPETSPHEYEMSASENVPSRLEKRPTASWGQSNSSKLLQCSSCDFQAKWSFQLRKHEEIHKVKRHSCPLCGMRFEHIAWLTKHLNRIHKGDSQAQNIAAAYELLKPNRRRPASTAVAPANEGSIKPVDTRSERPTAEKPSVLSSLLRSTGPAKYSPILSKTDTPSKFKSPANESLKRPQENNDDRVAPANKKRAPPCRICGYRTKWISELEKHMRVHSNEKPFQCSRCSYHSKWKGDLTRHMMKHHNIKVPIIHRRGSVPKLKLKKTLPNRLLPNRWHTVPQESASSAPASEGPSTSGGKEQESPLDLTTCKNNIFMPSYSSALKDDDSDSSLVMDLKQDTKNGNGFRNSQADPSMNTRRLSSSTMANSVEDSHSEDSESNSYGKRKYHCPFCTFTTSTPSRFHVHIVQHYNKKPFMCSLCGYRSNWEWDITKHIRLRGCKDKEHNSACVLLTDETGRRNYEKYDKYLRDAPKIHQAKAQKVFHNTRAVAGIPEPSPKEVAASTASAAEEAPVNIVVTPDIPFADDGMEQLDMQNYSMDFRNEENNSDSTNNGFKFYLCKHCNYKHSSRKVVISHLSVHAGVRPFRCKVCGLTANWRHIVVRHVKVAHNGYMNDVEDRITYTQEGFVIRITSVKNSKVTGTGTPSGAAQYTCKFCPYKCDKEVYIKFHMKQHKPRDGAIYQCSFCPYYVKFKKTLVRHMKLHEPPRPDANPDFPERDDGMYSEIDNFALDGDCEDNYAQDGNAYLDYSNGDDQMGYANEDSIAVSYSQLSAQDVETYDPVEKAKRHVCEHCPYRTDNRTQYLYHKQFHRPNLAAPFKCTLCTYWATMQHLLTQHMKVHRRNDLKRNSIESAGNCEMPPPSAFPPPHQQQLMGSGQPQEGNEIPMVLVQRAGIVTKMFKCRFCPMMNKKRANVRVHERMHGATQIVGKYTCTLCNYKCLSQGSLTNHMKIHQNSDYESIQQEEVQPTATESNTANRKKVFSYFCMRCPAVFKSSSDLYIHRTFHGSNLPFPCPQCDYRAKHKPHLQKHLQVHTDAYVSKRDASFGPPVNPDYDNATEFLDCTRDKAMPVDRRVDQMLLLEVAEVKMFLKRGKDFAAKRMHKCPLCPAYFSKTTVLAYHCSLHGSGGEFGCTQCDYSTVRSENLTAHSQVHSKTDGVVKRSLRVLQCPKCPASFTKTDRFERHLDLHGKNYRYACDMCDYSVRFAANLSKHKYVHFNAEKNAETAKAESSAPVQNLDAISKAISHDKTPNDVFKLPEIGEEKKMYICDRCPYFQGRKDAVQSHQQRHFQKEGYQCPYCDYRSLGSSFLREHVKSHIQPSNLFLPQTFMKRDGFKIYVVNGDSKEYLFEDKGTNHDVCDRFYPAVGKRDDLIAVDPTVNSTATKSAVKAKASSKMSKRVATQMADDVAKAGPSEKSHAVENQPLLSPKVVLKDIFADDNKLRELESIKIENIPKRLLQPPRETKPTGPKKTTTAEKSKPKSSIIVKIRVENIIEDNNERSLYTISSKKSNKTDSCSDAASDVTIPADDIEDLSPACDTSTIAEENDMDTYCDTAADGEPNGIAGTSDTTSNVPLNMKNSVEPDTSAKFQDDDVETDFLKQLDFMVNNVTMNSSMELHNNESTSKDQRLALL